VVGGRLFWALAGFALLVVGAYVLAEPWGRPGAALVAIIVGLGVAGVITWRRTVAIQRASEAAARLSQGDFRRQLPETGRGELGELYRSINRLAEEMRGRLREMEAEKAETDTLLREMGEGVLALSSKGVVLRANAILKAALGGAEPVEGKTLATLFRNPALVHFLRPEGVPADGAEREFEVFGRTMLVSARRLPAGGVVAVFSDLTPIRRLQRVRTEFVANASHELKTPLTAIRGYAETLLDASMPEADREKFAQRIVDHADRMSAIVDDLLTLARLEEPGRHVERKPVPLATVVEDIWATLESRARDIDLAVEIEPRDLKVDGDPEGVRQVVENLLDNAIRHSGARRVGVRARRSEGEVRVTVWDEGQGIPTAHLGRIFERFYRVDPSRSRASGGTGLGLSIVRHWTEVMGGRVWAESAVGQGTEIHVVLPTEGSPDA
jgi:two-component system phosphate regulon sensor histidine kinase PhoR